MLLAWQLAICTWYLYYSKTATGSGTGGERWETSITASESSTVLPYCIVCYCIKFSTKI